MPSTWHARSGSSEEAGGCAGAAGTAAFRRGAAQRGEVGRAAAARGRTSRGKRRGVGWNFLGAIHGVSCCWALALPCAMARTSWEREAAAPCYWGRRASLSSVGRRARSRELAPRGEQGGHSAAYHGQQREEEMGAMGAAPAGNPTHAARAATKGKGRLHQGTWPWRRAGRRRAPKELGQGCICWAPWKKNRGHGRHGCWWLPAAAGHGEKRVALGRGNELSAGRWSRGPARVLEPAQGRGGDAMDGQGGSQACCRGARRKKGSGGCIFLRGGSAKMPPLARRWLLFIERH
jgi:hypothetical protein